MRNYMSTDETYNEIFDKALQTLAKLFKADLSTQRMYSVHVKSNMRNLGKKEGSLFAMVKPSESSRTLDQLAEDVFILTQHFWFQNIHPRHKQL
jgi:hypothetical protein